MYLSDFLSFIEMWLTQNIVYLYGVRKSFLFLNVGEVQPEKEFKICWLDE